MISYYACLTIGVIIVIISSVFFIQMMRKKKWQWRAVLQMMGGYAIGSLLLWMTMPQVTDVVSGQLTRVTGACTIEVDTSSRRAHSVFAMTESGERFHANDVLYVEEQTYQCELLVTKDRFWVIEYSVYDTVTKQRMYASSNE